jgi:hypothetical protein
MFGSEILDIGVGVAFVYLLLSLVCTVLNEWIAGVMGLRAKNLEAGIRSLFSEGKITIPASGDIAKAEKFLADAVYDHGLIQSLSRADWIDRLLKREGRPSYIPANLFSMALVDTLVPADGGEPKSIEAVRTAVAKLPPGSARQMLLTLLSQANIDVVQARQAIESWYNDGMDRVAGWYKRKVQLILIILALLLTVATNTDTIVVVKALISSPALRASTVDAAQNYIHEHSTTATAQNDGTQKTIEDLRKQLQQLSLPVGWSQHPANWWSAVLGWLLTTVAVSLGAPFWFDVLNKFMVVRSTVKPREKSQNEASKDATK